MADRRSRAGVLVISAWVESGDTVRARITRSTGPTGEELVTPAASAEDVLEVVHDWLDALVLANGK